MMRVTFGKSRVREIRMPGSVRAKAEWRSYSATVGISFSSTGYDVDAVGCSPLSGKSFSRTSRRMIAGMSIPLCQ